MGHSDSLGVIVLQAELLARLVVGTVLEAIIGYERDVHGRPPGLRTHLIVALASTTCMLISTRFVDFQHYAREDLVTVDTSRIAAAARAVGPRACRSRAAGRHRWQRNLHRIDQLENPRSKMGAEITKG